MAAVTLGVDVSARWFDVAHGPKVTRFPNTAPVIAACLRWVAEPDRPARIGMEATGAYHLPLATALYEAGFDPAPAAGGAGERVGLVGMRERLALLGGTLAVRSAPGRGTTVRAALPLAAGPAGGAAPPPRRPPCGGTPPGVRTRRSPLRGSGPPRPPGFPDHACLITGEGESAGPAGRRPLP